MVALTAHILAEHKERARQAGMDGHMAKPVELSQLRELVEYWVVQRDQHNRNIARLINPSLRPSQIDSPRMDVSDCSRTAF